MYAAPCRLIFVYKYAGGFLVVFTLESLTGLIYNSIDGNFGQKGACYEKSGKQKVAG